MKGKALPPLDTFAEICNALGCSADSLLKEDQNKEEKEYEGIKWFEGNLDRFPLQQREEISQGIALFYSLVVRGESASDLMAGMSQNRREHWQDMIGSFEVALRSGAFQIKSVPRDVDLEKAIKEKYGLKFVAVAKLPKVSADKYMDGAAIGAEFVSFLAANEILDQSNFNGDSIGIGQGYTIMRMMEQSIPTNRRFRGTDWIPLTAESITGSGFSRHTSRYIAQAMSKRHPGSKLLSLPYIKPDRREDIVVNNPNREDEREKAAAKAIERLRAARAIFVTVNSLDLTEAHFYGDFPPEAENALRTKIEAAGLGDRAVALFEDFVLDADGNLIENTELQKVIENTIFTVRTQDFERVRRFGNSWLLAAGDHKAKPVLAVLKMEPRAVDSIIIDSIIGEYLVSQE
jgi:DNA-binding transcriptional regulator LsrR (DeoR family)